MNAANTRASFFTHRWSRRFAWTVAAVLLIWLLAWAIVPPMLKHQLVKMASAELGRALTVGEIDFKPWTLELTVRDLSIATRDGASAQLAIERIYVDAELESLVRLAPVVQALEIDAPTMRLRRTGEGRYDIDDLLARFAPQPTPTPSDSKPAHFALFNLAVRDGSVDLDDQPVARQHVLRGLNLSLPFLSNLPSRRDVTVTPALAFTLNDAVFESKVVSTPFAPSQETEAQFRIQAMDLRPYLAYIPRSVPVKLRQAVLDADLQLQFVQSDRAQLIVTGQLQLSELDLADSAGAALLTLDRLSVTLDEMRPLEQAIRIGTVELQSPRLQVRRDSAGRLNLAPGSAGAPDTPPAAALPAETPAAAVPPAATPASSAAPGGRAAPAGWTASMARLQLRDGLLEWRDTAITPGAHMRVDGLTLDVDDMVWPMERAAKFKGSLAVAPATTVAAAAARGQGGAASKAATVAFEGSGTDQQVTVRLLVSDAPLGLGAPYVAQFLLPELRGQLNTDMALRWGDAGLQLTIASLSLDQLALVNPGAGKQAGLPQIGRLALSSASMDLDQRLVRIDKLEITQPELTISRGADKRWMFESWLKTPSGSTPVAKPSGDTSGQTAWKGQLEHLLLRDAAVRFDDNAQSKPVRLAASAVNLDMRNIAFDGKQPVPTQFSARVAAGQGQAGKIDYRGTLQVEPLQTRGKLLAEQLPLHALEPYFAAGLNIEVLRADAGFKGEVAFAATTGGPQLRLQGDTVLEDFRANSLVAGTDGPAAAQELLNWKALGVRGVDLALEPGKPLRLAVRETTLSDFYARVIVHESGRINLQDLVRGDAPPAPANGAAAGASVASASGPGVAAPAPAPVATVAAADPMAPQIRIGPISLVQGRVYFSDRFVKPNYSANLSELTGKLSAFSSASASAVGSAPAQPLMADLELRGRAEGTASLEILGKLNPLADPLALDIKGIVRDLELPPLSPYSIKYAGHGIERGKLSVDVAYQILPDGQLTANNQIVLNQLTFGDKVDGAPNSLPVKLAVALLADSKGVIDINLPVSGSLNDPQFRLGPLIFKVIVNLIGKALTAPFTLLASAFGGGADELSQVPFAPGSARLQPDALAGLDKVAKALTDRPALKMTVIGTANLEAEREAYKRGRLQAMLQAEKRRAQVTAGQTPLASGNGQAELPLEPAESAELLVQLFARSEIARPRDLAGKPKELTTADMEALLLANIAADEESMRELALRRSVAVKDYLAGRQLPVERLFLGAAKLADADAKWSPRAELNLGTN